jgi:excisionase family DNA binding protein
MDNQLLTTKEAAKYLGVSKAFLERDRWAGAQIPFVQIGLRTVRYRQAVLDEYIANRTRLSTSEETARRSRKGKPRS